MKILRGIVLTAAASICLTCLLYGLEKKEAAPKGKIVICEDRGFSGFPERSADLMAGLLKARGYEVEVIKTDLKAGDLSDIYALIVTGPIYAGNPTWKCQGFLNKIPSGATFQVLVYVTYGGEKIQGEKGVEDMLNKKNIKLTGYSGFRQPMEKSDQAGWNKSIEEFVNLIQ